MLLGVLAAAFGAYTGFISTKDRKQQQHILGIAAVTCLLFLVQGSFAISDQREADKKQEEADKRQREADNRQLEADRKQLQAEKTQEALKQQIQALVAESASATTSKDVSGLRQETRRGLDDIRKALKIVPARGATFYTSPPKLTRYSQRRVESEKPTLPFALQVIAVVAFPRMIQNIVIECDGPIQEQVTFVAGMVEGPKDNPIIKGNQITIRIVSTEMSSDPLIFLSQLFSKTAIKVTNVRIFD